MSIRVGIAGWSLTAEMKAELPETGSHLERYSTRFDCVEINSSFYKPHRRTTYERWADSVAKTFRFAVKVPKVITHERRLNDCDAELAQFLDESAGLGVKLAVYVVQLPPSLAFDHESCTTFFRQAQTSTAAALVVEPRHTTWFSSEVAIFLNELGIGRVAADPALLPVASEPGGDPSFRYFRLHGSPQMYYSNYSDTDLRAWHAKMRSEASDECWCIFDNTAVGAAFNNATTLKLLTGNSTEVVE